MMPVDVCDRLAETRLSYTPTPLGTTLRAVTTRCLSPITTYVTPSVG